jgi:hypothetical protein
MSVGTMMMRRVVLKVRCDWTMKSVKLHFLVNLERDSKREREREERLVGERRNLEGKTKRGRGLRK